MRIIKYLILCLAVQVATSANAKDIPDPITPYVSDYANLIDPETEARIIDRLVNVRKDLDLEMRVVTIESRFDYGDSPSIEEFAKKWFNTWGIGNATRNDGVLVLVSRSDREIRIELGSSYGMIYDDRMGLVIQHHFLPYFVGDEYGAGIEAGTIEAIKRLQPTYDVVRPETIDRPSPLDSVKRTPFWRFLEDKLGLLVFIGIAGFLFLEANMRSILVGLTPCPNCRQRQLRNRRSVIRRSSRILRGEEKVETFCSSCDYSSIEMRSIPLIQDRDDNDHSGFSGGSSSGGGGSSSGGGATGRW